MDIRTEDQNMNMEDVMDASMDVPQLPQPFNQHNIQYSGANTSGVLTEMDRLYEQMRAVVVSTQSREQFRDIAVKVHIRRPERDSWAYMGRAIVTQEILGQSSRVVVRSATSHKILTVFGEGAALQAERRGNFVVVGCIEAGRVVSWSLNALNNSETVRLLASIELACYACKQAMADPALHLTFRRRVARMIKDDRRRRHKRRKEQDSMVAAFARAGIDEDEQDLPAGAPPPTEPVPIPEPVPMPIPQPASVADDMFANSGFPQPQ